MWPKFTFLESPPSRYGLVDPRTLSNEYPFDSFWHLESAFFPRNFVFSHTFSFVPVDKIQLLSIRKWHLMCMRVSRKGGKLTRAGHTWLSPGMAKSDQHSITCLSLMMGKRNPSRVQIWNRGSRVVWSLAKLFIQKKNSINQQLGGLFVTLCRYAQKLSACLVAQLPVSVFCRLFVHEFGEWRVTSLLTVFFLRSLWEHLWSYFFHLENHS